MKRIEDNKTERIYAICLQIQLSQPDPHSKHCALYIK
jgi:hypothetical protein